ncbi:MAG: FIVAR domain-containing protein, partial [Bifidobacteriaceae bacterium]|nr:FIVAR domain-containing protein [Bifidobacteriaceae bacterium]
ADGTTKSTAFPVVVHAGALTSEYSGTTTTLFAQQVALADRRVTLDDAADGVLLNASVVPATSAATYQFTIAPMDENTAQASITPAGTLTATAAGRVKVHVIATVGGTNYVRSAIITVQTAPVTQSEGLAEQVIAAEARGYHRGAYTVSSWQAYDAALAAATAALDNPASTQSVIDQVAGALTAAEAALTPRADLTGISSSVALVQGLLPARLDYTQGTWAALNTAYIAAGALLADPSGTSQAQADAGANALNAAIAGLVLDPDRFAVTSLAWLVDALATADLVGADYTSASWDAYRQATRAATSVLAQDPVNRLSAAAALTSLDNAARWLVHRVPTAGLAAQVAAAAAVPTAGYTQVSVRALATALTIAESVLAANPDSVTQAQVATAQARLAAALSGLEALIPQPGPTVVVQQPGQTTVAADPASARGSLGALVGQASVLDQASFTAESWAAFAAALGTARAVAGSAASSPGQVSSAVVSLTAAFAGLVKVPVVPPTVEQPRQDPDSGTVPAITQSVKAGTVTIKGTAKVGKRLTAKVATWTTATKYSYQWYSGNTKIKNATNKTLKLTKALKGTKIKVVVTGTKKGMISATKTSKATKKIQA